MGSGAGAKKGQIIAQVFIFILAGLVFILIISYGYRAIQYFLEKQEQVVLVDFRNDLELAIEGVRRDFGTVRKVNLKLPSEYDGVCFFDSVSCAEGKNPVLELPSRSSLKVGWAQEACFLKSENVFIVPRVGEKLYFPELEVEGGYLCLANVDGVTLRLEGTGRKARASVWVQ
jgi:hypothetical protein